jgi:hypothetical protein
MEHHQRLIMKARRGKRWLLWDLEWLELFLCESLTKYKVHPSLTIYLSEKLLKLDAKRREYDVVVIGEEPHFAYNRVGLTSFFEHRDVEKLYMQTEAWVSLSHSAI